tara:strand:- start:996 stop:1664 length:669 start_codon:yes stop_codon:yes gene_type:complete
MKIIIDFIYNQYAKNKRNYLRPIHRTIISSKIITEYLFGCKLVIPRNVPKKYKFDLTTILLRNLFDTYLDNINRKKILELGTGPFGILAIYCYKNYATEKVVASDIRSDLIDNCQLNVDFNDAEINIIQSDLFENIRKDNFDVIFWNLPYYEKKKLYLIPLIEQVHDYLANDGVLLIGYNTNCLKEEEVKNLVHNNTSLHYEKGVKYTWNNHIISIIKKKIN